MAKFIKFSIECWVFDKNQKRFLLLQCPENEVHIAYWQPVTGGIEDGESDVDACIREVHEETGILLAKKDIVRLIDRFRVYSDEKELNKTVFVVEADTPVVTISDEHNQYKWVPPDSVSNMLLWGSNIKTYQAVKEYFDSMS